MAQEIHTYDKVTGEYIGSGYADPNPLEPNEWLIPALATKTAPPLVGEGEVAVFNEDTNVWTREVDLRGTPYWDPNTGAELQIQQIGEEVPPHMLLAAPTLPPSKEDVTKERDRRLLLDFVFEGNSFQRRDQDVKRIAGAGTLALGAMFSGALEGDYRWHGGSSDFVWIAADNTPIPMDAPTVFALGSAAAAIETKMILAAAALKAMDPIPEDFEADVYWT